MNKPCLTSITKIYYEHLGVLYYLYYKNITNSILVHELAIKSTGADVYYEEYFFSLLLEAYGLVNSF